MKPFSPVYYIRENKMRSILLIIMFMLSYIAWVGGLYATNIMTLFEISNNVMERCAIASPLDSDEGFEKIEQAAREANQKKGIKVMRQGVVSQIFCKSIMGFDTGHMAISFLDVEDFKAFCKIEGISCDYDKLKKGSVIMGELMAKNRGMKLGDKLKENEGESVYGTYTLDAVIDDLGYNVYYIDTGKNGSNYSYILLNEGMDEAEFTKYVNEWRDKYNLSVIDKEYMEHMIKKQLSSIIYIYVFIVIIMAIVMAVTINAAFVGMYQHRQPEFAIYRAIGIKKSHIIGKVVGELLLMDVIGIVAGGVVFFMGLYLFNNLYLIPNGQILFYYHSVALFGMLLCNLMVIIPLVVTRSRQLLKADICEY